MTWQLPNNSMQAMSIQDNASPKAYMPEGRSNDTLENF